MRVTPKKWNRVYRPNLSRLYVSDGRSALRIFDSKTYEPIKALKPLVDADPIVYGPATRRLFVVKRRREGKASLSKITVFDTNAGIQNGDMQLDGIGIEGMAVEKAGPRLFATRIRSMSLERAILVNPSFLRKTADPCQIPTADSRILLRRVQ